MSKCQCASHPILDSFWHIWARCLFIVPEAVCLAEEDEGRPVEEEEKEVDLDLPGCLRKDLTAGCVPLLPLLWEHRESLLSDFTSLEHSQKRHDQQQELVGCRGAQLHIHSQSFGVCCWLLLLTVACAWLVSVSQVVFASWSILNSCCWRLLLVASGAACQCWWMLVDLLSLLSVSVGLLLVDR